MAIEGVQPLIPENPPLSTAAAGAQDSAKGTSPQKTRINGQTKDVGSAQPAQASSTTKPPPTTKSHLSRELQQYYARLTDSLTASSIDGSSDAQVDRRRTAALSSLRNDAGLQGILPYLVRWIGDNTMSALTLRNTNAAEDDGMGAGDEDVDRKMLEVILLVVNALLDNQRLFVEPYVSSVGVITAVIHT